MNTVEAMNPIRKSALLAPLLPLDIQMKATPSRSVKVGNGFYITLRRCDIGGERKMSFYWKSNLDNPTVADVLSYLITQAQGVWEFTNASWWITTSYSKDHIAGHLLELTAEFSSRKALERKLRKFLGQQDFEYLMMDARRAQLV